ncbi:MAG: hypothetical protein R3A51_20460 [Nannocystaceae bacterium]
MRASSRLPRPRRARLTAVTWAAVALAGLMGLGACAPFKLEPPPGFAEVQDYERNTRMKAGDNVGLSVRVFDNVRGGTLAYWAEDLVTKLGARGYQLTAQKLVKSKNGEPGTRFDFDYQAPGEDIKKFYSAVLFVTDRYRIVLQVAGDAEHNGRYLSRIDGIVAELKVGGCKLGSKICGGAQPPPLKTPPPPAPESDGEDTPSEDSPPPDNAPADAVSQDANVAAPQG